MSSKADRNRDATLAMVMGMATTLIELYEQRERSKTVLGILRTVEHRSKTALKMWPGKITPKDFGKMTHRIECFRKEQCGEYDGAYYSSLALALTEDIRRYFSGTKRDALDQVISSLKRLNWYFDRNYTKTEIYEQAANGADCWGRLEA